MNAHQMQVQNCGLDGMQGNPSFATVVKVMHALGLQFDVGARSVQVLVPNQAQARVRYAQADTKLIVKCVA